LTTILWSVPRLTAPFRFDGWEIFAHDERADCQALIREHGIDALITDFNLGAFTGLDLIEQLRDAGVEIPVLMLSANVYAIDQKRAELLGVFQIMAKPPDLRRLRRTLVEAVAAGNAARPVIAGQVA
jgi:DNA-binding response OmpR family regulator